MSSKNPIVTRIESEEEEDMGEEENPAPEADKLADELAKTHIQS